ncbi:Cerato-platanin-domain-containing protein [Aspergillus carlsbadensis]|nr:Cerato-platanin-domain-containing protein [Aspergillus carlsbadensis]
MKLTATLLPLLPALTFAAPSSNFKLFARQSGSTTLSYDPKFDIGSTSLNTVACSNGDFGLVTEGYTTFDSLPSYFRIGGAPTIAGWGSDKCGACYQIQYTSAAGAVNSMFVTAVDAAPGGFNVGVQAMDLLTGGRAVELGRVDVVWTEVARENCGLENRP